MELGSLASICVYTCNTKGMKPAPALWHFIIKSVIWARKNLFKHSPVVNNFCGTVFRRNDISSYCLLVTSPKKPENQTEQDCMGW